MAKWISLSNSKIENSILDLILNSGEIHQNEIWKKLNIDRRKCSRIINKLDIDKKIVRKYVVIKRIRTYLIIPTDLTRQMTVKNIIIKKCDNIIYDFIKNRGYEVSEKYFNDYKERLRKQKEKYDRYISRRRKLCRSLRKMVENKSKDENSLFHNVELIRDISGCRIPQ